ncbi:MAG: VapE domain-containing protein [Bacteroidales bacterium]
MTLNDFLETLARTPDQKLDRDTQRSFLKAIDEWDGDDNTMPDRVRAALEQHANIPQRKIDSIHRKLLLQVQYGAAPSRYGEFIAMWTRKHNVRFTMDRTLTMREQPAHDNDVFNRLLMEAVEFGFERRHVLLAAWQVWKTDMLQLETESFRTKISYSPDIPDRWDELVNALVDPRTVSTHTQAIAKAVLQQFVWRVKNKVAGKRVDNHVMPYLRGTQGCGKSTFMRWFLSNVDEGVAYTTFDIFAHDEKADLLRTTPILVFDEMVKADRANVAAVKNSMTADTLIFRKLYGEASKSRVMATYIGAGNLDLEEVMYDATGLRRFYQIDTPQNLAAKLEEIKDAGVRAIDLWRSINENAPSPLEQPGILKQLIDAQQEHKLLSPLETWLAEVTARASSEFKHTDELYDAYSHWKITRFPGDRMNINQFQTQLKRTLRDGGYPHDHKLDARSRRSMYLLGKPKEAPTPIMSIVDEAYREAA